MIFNTYEIKLQLNSEAAVIDIAEHTTSATGVGSAFVFQQGCHATWKSQGI